MRILSSFISDRSSSVIVGETYSDPVLIHSGVPQGSILGPRLFNIFMSDFLLGEPQGGQTGAIQYADDLVVMATDERPDMALNSLRDTLPMVSEYYKKWGMKINESRSSMTCFRNASGRGHYLAVRESKNLNLYLNGIRVPLKPSMTYVGVEFNERFQFNPQGRKALRRARAAYAVTRPLLFSKTLNWKVKLLIFKALITPILGYGFSV